MPHYYLKTIYPKRTAFTLAEVLIVLGIIGLIADMTIPTLVGSYRRKTVAVKLSKFYSTFNQAIKLSEAENGSIANWPNVETAFNPDSMEKWWNTYLNPYFKIVTSAKLHKWLLLGLPDGSGVGMMSCGDYPYAASCMHVLYCISYDKCVNGGIKLDADWGTPLDGKNAFLFYITANGLKAFNLSTNSEGQQVSYTKREDLMNPSLSGACGNNHVYSANSACGFLIQYDGWQVKEDYPVKF